MTGRFTRRHLIYGAVGATAWLASGLANAQARQEVATPAEERASSRIGMSPAPGSRTAYPSTTIAFRGVTRNQLGQVDVVGAQSGAMSGILIDHPDGNGVSFVPDSVFEAGEVVTVETSGEIGESTTVEFRIGRPAPHIELHKDGDRENPEYPPREFISRPDLKPCEMGDFEITDEATIDHVFVSPRATSGQSGPMILDRNGELVWYHPLEVDTWECVNLERQSLNGQPVLTYWQGIRARGYGFGHYVILNDRYEQIATIQAGNGMPGTDIHDMRITPEGTALITIYAPYVWNQGPVGGPANGLTLAAVVQEIDIETGLVLYEWNSLDHVTLEEAMIPRQEGVGRYYDYFHINSISLDDDNLILSARDTWTIYKIDRVTGEIIWRLGGADSDFEMAEGTGFRFQHDANRMSNGSISLFDNASGDQEDNGTIASRGLVLDLDMDTMRCTLGAEYIHPTGILSTTQGSVREQGDGTFFVGWGSTSAFSQFSADGDLIYNGRFGPAVQSYRAYNGSWSVRPKTDPDMVVTVDGAEQTAYVSWNGATDITSWRFIGGENPDDREALGNAKRSSFETEFALPAGVAYVTAEAVDASGTVLGTSRAVRL